MRVVFFLFLSSYFGRIGLKGGVYGGAGELFDGNTEIIEDVKKSVDDAPTINNQLGR